MEFWQSYSDVRCTPTALHVQYAMLNISLRRHTLQPDLLVIYVTAFHAALYQWAVCWVLAKIGQAATCHPGPDGKFVVECSRYMLDSSHIASIIEHGVSETRWYFKFYAQYQCWAATSTNHIIHFYIHLLWIQWVLLKVTQISSLRTPYKTVLVNRVWSDFYLDSSPN